ncbi:hypothetical protein [Metallibacterium sp.]|uniref:hypothetical protein n=1 Tax=Metallibacterium sp. TaxID=2940281 RepID=UPI00260C5E21|nr:hypothetical protein [Metallibacterium sp.]
MSARLRSAPFAREIENLLAISPCCSWRLFAAGRNAERWRNAKSWIIRGHHAATLLPLGCDPAALRWPSGSVIADVTDAPGDVVHALAEALIRDGVEHAVLVDMRTPARTVHVKVAPAPQQVAA